MSIVNDSIVKDIEQSNDQSPVQSSFLFFLIERIYMVTSTLDYIGMEGPMSEVYVNKTTDDCNVFCCCAALTLLPEIIIDLVGLVACFIPSLFVDCCQGLIGNTKSHNMLIVEKKMLRINDEVVISDEFNIAEIIDIQYRRGSLGQFLFNRNHYHHQPSGNLIDPESRAINTLIQQYQSSRLKGTIVRFGDGGNVDVEFKPIELEGKGKIIRLSPLIVERTTYTDEEMTIYSENLVYLKKGEWIETLGEDDPTAAISFETPTHPNYQSPVDKLIPCVACAGIIVSLFCYHPSCYGCNLTGEICMLNNVCTCLKVSRNEQKLCICCNANVSCIRPRSICKLLYQCFCLDCRIKIPPCINVVDTNSLRDFPCLCSVCGVTCCYQYHNTGPHLFKSINQIRGKVM